MTPGYEALRRGAAWLDASDRGRIVVRGRDRARLLHNLSSNEVKKLVPGAGCYAFLLNPQGRIQADLTILCFDGHFLLDTEPDLREKVPQLIRRYIIADQVEVEDVTERSAAFAVEGPEAAATLAALGAPIPKADYAHIAWADATVAFVSVTDQPGYRIYLPERRQVAPGDAVWATAEDARAVRIENGRPRYGEDIRDTTLVQETQQMHAVSFTKGCYLGQEIVERVRAQGHVNKKLMRLEVAGGELPAPGAKLTAAGVEAGEITSSVYSPSTGKVAALAYVRTPLAEAGKQLDLGGITAVVL